MEDGHPDAPQAVAGTKPKQKDQGAQSLAHRRHRQDPPGQPDDAAHLQSAHRIHQHRPAVQADPPSQQHGDEDGHGHKAQAAHLDQKQNHSLTEESELRPGVIEHQSGHAGSRRGGKYRIQKRQRLPRAGGDGQHQQKAAQQNDAGKTQRQILHCVERKTVLLHGVPPVKTNCLYYTPSAGGFQYSPSLLRPFCRTSLYRSR